ncbi:hypothetical protein FKM82_003484 [Ascaphus truei]
MTCIGVRNTCDHITILCITGMEGGGQRRGRSKKQRFTGKWEWRSCESVAHTVLLAVVQDTIYGKVCNTLQCNNTEPAGDVLIKVSGSLFPRVSWDGSVPQI